MITLPWSPSSFVFARAYFIKVFMSRFPIGGKGSLELAVRVSEITLFESSSSTFFQSGTSA